VVSVEGYLAAMNCAPGCVSVQCAIDTVSFGDLKLGAAQIIELSIAEDAYYILGIPVPLSRSYFVDVQTVEKRVRVGPYARRKTAEDLMQTLNNAILCVPTKL